MWQDMRQEKIPIYYEIFRKILNNNYKIIIY